MRKRLCRMSIEFSIELWYNVYSNIINDNVVMEAKTCKKIRKIYLTRRARVVYNALTDRQTDRQTDLFAPCNRLFFLRPENRGALSICRKTGTSFRVCGKRSGFLCFFGGGIPRAPGMKPVFVRIGGAKQGESQGKAATTAATKRTEMKTRCRRTKQEQSETENMKEKRFLSC